MPGGSRRLQLTRSFRARHPGPLGAIVTSTSTPGGEGAIDDMGFRAGVEAWTTFLRPGRVLAISELTWLCPDPPEEIRRHWNVEYPVSMFAHIPPPMFA